jgi:hypothetical protein
MAITRLGPNQDITAAKIAGQINFKNLIINGDMSIAQRGTSTSGITGNGYAIDRYRHQITSAGTWTISQSTDVPTGQGFAYSQKLDCTTADASLGASDRIRMMQRIEGNTLQSLKFGTSNAESITISFWVKSNKTGTYSWSANDNSDTKLISASYTIDSANTWEKKTLTFAGTDSPSIGIDNTSFLQCSWWLGTGSTYSGGTYRSTWTTLANSDEAAGQTVNLADDTANEWYITGVQLEADTSASDFEFLPYDVNFKRCQRYFESSCAPLQNPSDGISSVGIIDQAGAHPIYQPMIFNTSKRAVPTMTYYNGSSGSTGTWRTNAGTDVSVSSYTIKIQGFTINCADLGAEGRSANGSWEADAEL